MAEPTTRLRYPCPLRTCDWAYEVGEPGPDGLTVHPGTDEVEAAIINHGHGHTAAQWIDEITALTQQITAPPVIQWCTLCVVEHKQAQLAGKEPEPVHPGVVLATTTSANGFNVVLLCEIRHPLNVAPPKLLVATAGAVPNGRLRG